MIRGKFFFTFFAWILGSAPAFANWQGSLAQHPQALSYYFEVSRTPEFTKNSVVTQGRVPNSILKVSLPNGIYFLRSRAELSDAKFTVWSPVQRIEVGTTTTITINTPQDGAVITVDTPGAPLFVEWSPIEGADSYEILFTPLKKSATRKLTSLSPFITATDIGPGSWSVQVNAVNAKQKIIASKPHSFTVKIGTSAQAQFIAPREGAILRAWVSHPLRFLRRSGIKSKIEVFQLNESDKKSLYSETIHNQESWLPSLAPGRYRVQISDLDSKDNVLAQSGILFLTEEDPLGAKRRQIGAEWRLFLNPRFGWNARRSDSISLTGFEKTNSPHLTSGTRFQIPVAFPFGVEFGASTSLSQQHPNDDGPFPSTNHLTEFSVPLSLTYTLRPWGPPRPLTLKAGLNWRTIAFPLKLDTVQTLTANGIENITSSRASFLALELGSEIKWGLMHRKLGFFGEAKVSLPLPFAIQNGSVSLSGSPSMIPSLSIEIGARRLIGRYMSLFVSGLIHLEHTQFSEDELSYDSNGDGISDRTKPAPRPNSTLSRAEYGTSFGIDFQL